MRHTLAIFSLLTMICANAPIWAADNDYGTITGWGQMVDPDGDCYFKVGKEAVTIGFSGAHHGLDAESGKMNAPRVVRSVQGDFTVQVTVDGNLPLPEDDNVTAYVSGGLVLLQDNRTYIRFERASFTRAGQINHYANFEQRIDAKRTRMGLFADFPLQNNKPVDLRFEVKSGTVRALIRHAGQAWHQMGEARVDESATFLIGISGVNTSQKPLNVSFHQFQFQQMVETVKAESTSELQLTEPAEMAAAAIDNDDSKKKMIDTQKQTRDFTAAVIAIQRRANEVEEMDDAARQKLIDDAVTLVSKDDGAASKRFSPMLVMGLSRAFQSAGDGNRSIEVFDRMIDILKDRDDDEMKRMVEQLKTARDDAKFKRNMIGKPLPLEGETLAGEKFDWSQYEGKVVLVDFWASWCAPCRREIPNVLAQYKKYHDQGFDVVGICLDTDLDKAKSYIADAEVPWPSLFEKDSGWKHPMAVRYKINAIPTAILVDRDGNAVSLAARGEKLQELLAKEFPETDGDDTDDKKDPASPPAANPHDES